MTQTDTSATGNRIEHERRLSGKLGTWQLMLTVLAFAAPIAVATGFIPIGFIYAGQGAPLVILATLGLMLLFTVGYVAMTKYIRRPGAFYTYISAGLGKIPGVSSAFLAAASYFMILVGAYAFTGVLVADLITSFGGPETSWVLWAIVAWISVVIIGYFNVDVSVRVMVTIMILEVVLIVLFDIGALVHSFVEGTFSAEAVLPTSFGENTNIPIAMVFVVLMFIGFEGTAIYRDETKNPDVTIPRATFGAILLVGLLHFATSFAMLLIYGDEAERLAAEDPESMFLQGIGMVLIPLFTKIAIVVVTTSQYASAIAVHNVVTRYTHSLALDGALPRAISRVHPRFKSPYAASFLVEGLAILVLIAVIVFGSTEDPGFYGQIMGVGLVGLILLMALVSLSVISYFARSRQLRISAFKSWIAPGIALLGLGALTIYNVIEFPKVHGGTATQATMLFGLLGVSIVAGLVVSTYFKFSRPDNYEILGASRLEDQQPSGPDLLVKSPTEVE